MEDARLIAEDYNEYWKDVTCMGGQVRDFYRSRESALAIVDSMCDNPKTSSRIPLRIQKEIVEKRKSLDKTDAGQLVRGDIEKSMKWMETLRKQDQKTLAKLVKRGDPLQSHLKDKVQRQGQVLDRLRSELQVLKYVAQKVVKFLLSPVFVFRA